MLLLSLLSYGAAAGTAQQATAPPDVDGPVRVEGGSVFKEGKVSFEAVEPAKVAPMPKGWEAYNNTAYKIDFGQGVVVGPHVIHFRVASARDRAHFERLRVLQAEWDKIDEKFFWRDRTILAPEAPAPGLAQIFRRNE